AAVAGAQLYESTDGGATLSLVNGYPGTQASPALPTPAILMGGERNGHPNADVLFVGTSVGLYARSAPGAVAATKWDATWTTTNGAPIAITVERDDWSSVWVTTDKSTVWHGTDVTGTHEAWTNVTGDLKPGDPSAPD